MRLFWYYAWHTFINTLRKLFKTWVLVFFVVCFIFGGVLGGVIGIIASSMDTATDESAYESEVIESIENLEISDESEEFSEESSAEEEIDLFGDDEYETEEIKPLSTERGLQIFELAAGGIVLLILILEVMGADKNGSAIFQPADVNILFASPMRPQSVLMFRIAMQLGLSFFITLYMLFQLPNLIMNLGMSPSAAGMTLLAWFMMIVFGKVLQILLYMLSATYPAVKSNLSTGLYVLLGLIVVGYFVTWRIGGGTPFEGAVAFFNGPVSRWIPIWGWIKSLIMFTIEGKTGLAVLALGLLLALGVAIIVIIYNLNVDYYEDAMAKSEEIAELQRQQREGGFRKRKKDRSEKLIRNELNRGFGASAIFYKNMYNRTRFATARIFTKTSITYLVVSVLLALLLRFMWEVPNLYIVGFVVGFIAFYRSLGNPLSGDVKMGYFRMIPESVFKKLFYSVLSGTAACALDLVPGLVVASVILEADLLQALAILILVVSLDFYSSIVGCFIDLSVPVSGGKNVKQMIQISFIYFGLIPDILVIGLGYAATLMPGALITSVAPYLIGAAVFNLIIGGVFFILSTTQLE
ncbi:MAG: hypothetical protein IKG91_04380 [Firmicutes bacterium]|nr:hypothetical protein [Bacillota bacterium]